MRILIAEDDPVLADGLTRSLRSGEYAVDCVNDGVAADQPHGCALVGRLQRGGRWKIGRGRISFLLNFCPIFINRSSSGPT